MGEIRKKRRDIAIIIFVVIAAFIIVIAIADNKISSEQISLSIGEWPLDNTSDSAEAFDSLKAGYQKAFPNVEIVPDTYYFSVDTYEQLAKDNKLPNLFSAYFTETNKIIGKGYAADITDELEEMGWKQYIDPDILSLLTDEDGRIYGIPYEVYVQGLYINKKIFREAGLVNPDGSIMIPNTLKEMAEYAQIIKEKTGKAGFCMPTCNNGGGWQFLNIAWNFGTQFMKSDDAGNYVSTFDTEETKNALSYIKDLEHVYHALPDNKMIDVDEQRKLFATEQVAMVFMSTLANFLVTQNGMAKEDILVARIPEGDGGRYAQIGGKVWMFSRDSTSEQIMAGLKWLDYRGLGPFLNDDQLVALENNIKQFRDEGQIIVEHQVFEMWSDFETNTKVNEIYKKYSNVDKRDYEDYLNFNGVRVRPEEPAHCQELYAILDKCIQEVILNEDANVDELIKNANIEFQTEYLNKDADSRST